MRMYNDKNVGVTVENSSVHVTGKMSNKRVKTVVNTYKAHIKNMVKGVQEPYVYKLKICSGHFPLPLPISGRTCDRHAHRSAAFREFSEILRYRN